MNKKAAFAGIDLGTTGIRIIVADERGKVLSVHTQNILDSTVHCDDPRASEQDPRFWKEALFGLLPRALAVGDEYELRAICVDSTS
jgi:sugar (pentulose or hexulose) kinase